MAGFILPSAGDSGLDVGISDAYTIGVENGVITATAKADHGLGGSTIVLVPHFGDGDNGQIDWQRDDAASTCDDVDLC